MGAIEPQEPLTPRGTSRCRGCGAERLVSVLDLGSQPLANEMVETAGVPDPAFPLHLRICPECGLGQVGEFVLPERIFGQEYPYISSVSSSWVAHAGVYARDMRGALGLTSNDLVVEVASNDGYLLEQVAAMGMPVLGVEPAGNVADLARGRGVPTISDFFGESLAQEIVDEHGHPRLVAANNVMAHVPDLQDFTAGLAALCDEHTVVTVENPSFLTLLRETQFDTIYHEHFSYLTAHAVQEVVAKHGMHLVRVDSLPTHGGSNRYWITLRTNDFPVHPSVAQVLAEESEGGLFDENAWKGFAARSRSAVSGLAEWLEERRTSGRTVAGYGAAAKGNTLMNAAGVGPGDLVGVVDGSIAKQGRYLPGSHIPVSAPGTLGELGPDDVLVLPWNIAAEVRPIIAELTPSAVIWVAVPSMRELQ